MKSVSTSIPDPTICNASKSRRAARVESTPLLEPAVIQALQITLALLGLIFSIVIGVRLASRFSSIQCAGKVLVPFIALSLLFTLINIYMLGRPIGMSHAM